ncbi:hypothetical protein J7E79_15080 [Bacillus sp. ISL-40]|uniref:hypothetical protein n=1 Tax=unclassified Bacillus (in: firmicutes) TaxID=185979 RepID=UPI001BE59293|nr:MULTISPECIES: hypothetical protein [unclassified Bacillus (in: firmicutes)]MBT2698726.1 hypothetical protein [Bacillus sp. ISL-40]MBT2720828.1 hypothetical protein [Bacillus sp. ISL-46]MBT2740892.1 hypothetical protein [Bacillus sp. ISL-77]
MREKTVIYLGKEYTLFYQYDSGYCEIMGRDTAIDNVKLVHFSELEHENLKKG